MSTSGAHLRLRAGLDAVLRAMRATEAARRTNVEAIGKADASPVTIADLASQVVVVRSLAARLGEVELPFDGSILGEESDEVLRGDRGGDLLERVVAAARAGDPMIGPDDVLAILRAPRADPLAGPCWTLDPVDGTKGFLRGGQYAIALAWLDDGPKVAPSVAVLACPRLSLAREGAACGEPSDDGGVVAFATRGGGARVSELARDGKPTPTSPLLARRWTPGAPIRLALSVEAAHGNADEAVTWASRLGRVEAVRLDSAAKYVLLAAGRVDLYLRIPRDANRSENIWDHAAGVLIAQEAGCVVRDLDGRALDFGAGATLSRNRGIVAACAGLDGFGL